ncbi:MAG: hypothetical protein HQL54_07435 [Magnetococcales bacterium]|nr:hypothetical protein [Magnetococcales bacterium]
MTVIINTRITILSIVALFLIYQLSFGLIHNVFYYELIAESIHMEGLGKIDTTLTGTFEKMEELDGTVTHYKAPYSVVIQIQPDMEHAELTINNAKLVRKASLSQSDQTRQPIPLSLVIENNLATDKRPAQFTATQEALELAHEAYLLTFDAQITYGAKKQSANVVIPINKEGREERYHPFIGLMSTYPL